MNHLQELQAAISRREVTCSMLSECLEESTGFAWQVLFNRARPAYADVMALFRALESIRAAKSGEGQQGNAGATPPLGNAVSQREGMREGLLRQVREAVDKGEATCTELAKRLGVSRQAVWPVLKGKLVPRLATARALAKALDEIRAEKGIATRVSKPSFAFAGTKAWDKPVADLIGGVADVEAAPPAPQPEPASKPSTPARLRKGPRPARTRKSTEGSSVHA